MPAAERVRLHVLRLLARGALHDTQKLMLIETKRLIRPTILFA